MAGTTTSTNDLPSHRTLLTSLITSLATSTHANQPHASNPVSINNPDTKRVLLTLHALLPHALLPALDLLDRNLVTGLHLPTYTTNNPPASRKRRTLHLVRTAQPPPRSRHATTAATGPQTTYVVQLQAWSCSCPAFAFSAFPADSGDGSESGDEDEGRGGWKFGGLTRGEGVAVCKHLLACVLAEWGGLGDGVEEREGEWEEVAGWCAGWGD